MPDILDAPREHGEAFDTCSEGEAGILLCIDTCGLEDVWVDNTRAEYLNPAGLFTSAASVSFTEDALHIDFDGGFGEGEKARSESYIEGLFKELLQEGLEGSFEVGEGNIFADVESFDLVKAGAMCGVDFVASVHGTGGDDAYGRLVCEHGANLNGGGMRSQESLSELGVDTFDHEGVLHIARGVIFWEVQCGEVMEVIFDFGSARDDVAHISEDFGCARFDDSQGMGSACGDGSWGERCISLGLHEALFERFIFNTLEVFVDELLDPVTRSVDDFSEGGSFFGREVAHVPHHFLQLAFFTGIGCFFLVQLVAVADTFEGYARLFNERIELCCQVFDGHGRFSRARTRGK